MTRARRQRRARGGREEGQATVELALALPAVLALSLLAVQIALVARDQLLVVHAARAAAREVAVDPAAGAAGIAGADGTGRSGEGPAMRAVVRSAPSLKPARVSTETSHEGGRPTMVKVSVTYRAPTDVPIVGRWLPDVRLVAKAAMRDETVRVPRNLRREDEEEAGTAS